MFLQKLKVRGIRNIRDADLDLSPGANLFFGQNGSGKTSLLEAVYILSRGRSFRSRNLRTVINHEDRMCTCFGLVQGAAGEVPVGVQRDEGGKFVFKVNGKQVTTASQLAETMPVQVINSDSFQLLEGSPGARRSFLDWGVFHVEHSYRETWSRFQKCLKHRNSLLRHGKIDGLQLSVWDREFCSLASRIEEYRRKYLEELVLRLQQTLPALALEGEFGFTYIPGWDKDAGPLEEQLARSYTRDRKSGYTHLGPHRADLKIYVDRQAAADVLSRGQTKSLVVGLKLAQGTVFRKATGQTCLYLLDDLPAELDIDHRQAVSRMLMDMGVQVMVTGVERRDLEYLWPATDRPPALFHVKHGDVHKIETSKG